MQKLIYTILYHPFINRILRNLIYLGKWVIPQKFWLHPSGTLNLTVNTQIKFKISVNQTSYIARELFYEKCEHYEYTNLFTKLIPKVKDFLDVGASFGYYSVIGAKINPDLHVHAFEPAEGPFFYLQKNIAINGLNKQIQPHDIALSHQSGEAMFLSIQNPKYPDIPNLSGEHNLGTKTHLKHKSNPVQTQTLDQFVLETKLENIDLIKIDTEGTEHHILKHAKESIHRFQPIIICEVLFNTIEKELEELMLKYNYYIYKVKGNFLQKAEQLQRDKDDGIRNCFFVPPSKLHLIEDLVKD